MSRIPYTNTFACLCPCLVTRVSVGLHIQDPCISTCTHTQTLMITHVHDHISVHALSHTLMFVHDFTCSHLHMTTHMLAPQAHPHMLLKPSPCFLPQFGKLRLDPYPTGKFTDLPGALPAASSPCLQPHAIYSPGFRSSLSCLRVCLLSLSPPASCYVPLRLWVLRGQDSAALCQHTSGEAEEPVSQQGEGLPAPVCLSARAQANRQLQPVSDRGRQAIDFRKPGRP